MESQHRWASWPAARGLFVFLLRTTMPLHALLNTPFCVVTLLLGNGFSPGLCAPVPASSADVDLSDVGSQGFDDYYGAEYPDAVGMGSNRYESSPDDGTEPGFRFSYNAMAPSKHMYEGVIICLLAFTAFIGLVVWVLKSNFEERQTRRMRREASLRDRNSNVSPLMTPDSEES